ncbi:MAG: transposase zinc-binding domain-containing protein [Pseudomonadales bacterium]
MQHHETSLPRFVLSEFQDYLRCGRLEYGFVRVKCNGCRHEHLVAFSCKRRGFCPSCGAHRLPSNPTGTVFEQTVLQAPGRPRIGKSTGLFVCCQQYGSSWA